MGKENQKIKAKFLTKFFFFLGMCGGIGLLFSFFNDKEQFAFSYLVSFVYFLSLSLGGLWFVLMQHVAKAGWSVLVRRIGEMVSSNLFWMGLFILPLLFYSTGDLFPWLQKEASHDAILVGKSFYLNLPFFFIRTLIYFVFWAWISKTLYSISLKQDYTGKVDLTTKMHNRAIFGVIMFTLTLTFFSFDWIMSLDPHWFSTIFGIYYLACSIVGFLALLALIMGVLKSSGYLKGLYSIEHQHDIGKLLFAFNVFWIYIAFSQFMLIWYANLGEETTFYHLRSNGNWKEFSTVLPILHFVIPFFFLISREVKRNTFALSIAAVWLLIVNYLDIYWLIMPNYQRTGASFGWTDVMSILFVGGFFFYMLLTKMQSESLFPKKDPYLHESLNFKNR